MGKSLTISSSVTYENQQNSNSRITIHYGGTRSGKTYSLIQWIIVQCLQNKEEVLVVRKTIPSLKRTVMKDFKDILISLDLWDDNNFNVTDRIYYFDNGSEVQFISTDDPTKLRGLKSSILWLEEANEIDEESWFQTSIRCTGPIILSLNPTVSPHHWIRNIDGSQEYFTTFRDNPYLEDSVVKAILKLEETNPKAWKVYGLGEFVTNDKAIYEFELVDGIPVEAEFISYGIDFGYSADPTAIVSIFKMNNELYIVEHCYEKGMVTSDIERKLKELCEGREEIWADSAEPRLIEELKRTGLNVRPVKKGKDSINFGIQVMQNYKLKIPKSCTNLVNEFYSYEWETDRFGTQMDRPVDFNNHLLDAMRYVGMMRLSNVATSAGKYLITVR